MENLRKRMEAFGMNSPEGEYVAFQNSVITEGPVEFWMGQVEAAMRLTLRKILLQTLAAMKGMRRVTLHELKE